MTTPVSTELPPSSQASKKKKTNRPQLKVVIDTNALYVGGSASDLVRQEIIHLVSDAKYPDLDVLWYMPETVRHERQYQMQTEALKLRTPIAKIERLLGHNLNLPDEALLKQVETKIQEKITELGLREIKLDYSLIEWPKLVTAAVYRQAPFEPGDKEKGFRDALVAESFLQLLDTSPKTPDLCRVVLVTSDGLLAQAVKDRITGRRNASVLANGEELKGLINTIVSNVGEDFIAQIKPKAKKLFFVSGDNKGTLFYRERIKERIKKEFSIELDAKPEGTTFREDVQWLIDHPNFSRKEGRRVFWTTRIEISLKAGKTVTVPEAEGTVPIVLEQLHPECNFKPEVPWSAAGLKQESSFYNLAVQSMPLSVNQTVTHKGKDIYDVLWSTEVTMAKELRKPVIEKIEHVETMYEPIP